MMVGMVCMGCVAVGGMGYFSILLTSSGFDPYFTATLLTANGICLTIAKGANGVVFDAIGTVRGSVVFFALMIVGLVLCCLAGLGNAVIVAAAAIIYGLGVSLATVGISMWSIDLSHEAERKKLVKDLQVCYAAGSFIFNLLPGFLMELTGTYVTSYYIMVVLCVACAAIVLGVYRAIGRC